ncbi:reverse transcriptase domain-containing protein [Tanacetum coccineum]|uniref:Reverse transcriptase domain-containing protein n=1 Tax=Tanacetum coccineum TaxID=301880 RepID=A0ABQ5FGU3_9ASTR
MQLMFIQMNCALRTRDMILWMLTRKLILSMCNVRFSIAASSSVPWIYMAQFCHTLKEDGSKYRLRFMLDKKELTLTLDDFRQIFHLPQETNNNHNSFVPPPSFSDMPWQTLCKIVSKCLTARVTGWDQPSLQIMQMLYCFVNNIHVDYAELLWEGLYYSLHHPTYSIPYPRFTKIIVSYYMTIFHDILRRARDMYHKLQDDDIMKNIFNYGRHKNKHEARENVALVDEHLASKEIEKIVDGQENIIDDISIPRNDEPNISGTRIEPRSDKESPEVEIAKEKEVEISKEKEVEQTNVVIPVNVNDEDIEITDKVYELKRSEKGKIVEEIRNSPIPTPIRSPRIHTNLVSSDTEKLYELTNTPYTTSSSSSPHKKLAKTNRLLSLFKTKPTRFKRYKSFFHELQGRYGYLFAHLRARFMPRKSFDTLADNLHDVMVETLPAMVDKHIKEQVVKQVPEQVRNQVPVYVAEGLILERQKAKEETERLIAKAILQERGNIQAQIFLSKGLYPPRVRDAIVVPEFTADNFELKHGLLTLVQNKQFFGHDKEDPHAHIRYFNKITSTMKFPNVPSTSVKLMLFPFSLEGAAWIWLEKEPPRSILTWDDLVSKFINKFFPPSKTTNLRNEITRFQQRFDETFYEAWDRFNDLLLRGCPTTWIFSFINSLLSKMLLNSNDQMLNSAAGGNFLDKMPRDCLRIIESKSKVRNSRNKPVVAKVSASSSTPGISPDVAELKDMVKALLLDKKNQTQAPAPVKAGPRKVVLTVLLLGSYRNCPTTIATSLS